MDVAFSYPGSPLGAAFVLLLALIALAAWVILAGSRFVQGGVVERPERVPQLYGYAVCLVCVFVMLSSAVTIVGNVFTVTAPHLDLTERYGIGPSLTSFEAYRATYDRERRLMMERGDARPDTTPEPELRRRYQALRADRIEITRFQAIRTIVTRTLALLLAAGLFVIHWRWLRRFQGRGVP